MTRVMDARSIRWVATILLILGGAPVPGEAADGKSFDRLVPEGATFYLSLRNLKESTKWLETSPLGEVWKHKDMEAFTKKLGEMIDKALLQADKNMGRNLGELKGMLQGEVACVFGDLEGIDSKVKPTELPFAILADVGKDRDKFRGFLKRTIDETLEKGRTRKSEADFRGEKITLLEPKGKENAKDGPGALAFAFADDTFVLSLSRPFLQDILANRSGGGIKPLAENTDYRAAREKYGKDAAVFSYVHVGKLLDFAVRMAKAEGGAAGQMQAMMMPRIFEMLGLKTVKALTLSVAHAAEGATLSLFCLAPGEPKGLLKAIWTKPQRLSFPALIPDDVLSCSVTQINFEAIWEMVESFAKLGSAMMSGGENIDGQEGPDMLRITEQRFGVNFKQDLIAPLGGKIIDYARFKKPYRDDTAEIALLLELKDAEKFQATIDKLLTGFPFLRSTQYLGRTLYLPADSDFDDDGTGEEDGEVGGAPAGGGGPFALAVTETHFVLGIPKALAEESIRRFGKEVKSVNNSPAFKAVSAHLPPSAIFISYASPEILEYLVHTVKAGVAQSQDDGDASVVVDVEDTPVDGTTKPLRESEDELRALLEKLPPGSVLSKPFAGFLSHGFVEERGIGFTSRLIFKRK
ncbi:MAG TPA: hypothetical protein VMT52_11965 [Planctomycetota bacterium]|nr:hypothetical protein [Planctomycetota bacterium]